MGLYGLVLNVRKAAFQDILWGCRVQRIGFVGIVTLTSVGQPEGMIENVTSIMQLAERKFPAARSSKPQSDLHDRSWRSTSGGVDGSGHG